MPTGLTQKIYDGTDTSLRNYILTCATQTDGGYYLSEKLGKDFTKMEEYMPIKMSDIYDEKIQQAQQKVRYYELLKEDTEECEKVYSEERKRFDEEESKTREERKKRKKRFEKMVKKVEAWQVPPLYIPLKELMMRQLEESIKHDNILVEECESVHMPTDMWVDHKLKGAKEELNYYIGAYNDEFRRIVYYNEYLKGLFELLKDIKE